MGKHRIVELSIEQRQELEKLINSGHAPVRSQSRARILLLLDRSQGQTWLEWKLAEAVMCSRSRVVDVRQRFVEEGVDAGAV